MHLSFCLFYIISCLFWLLKKLIENNRDIFQTLFDIIQFIKTCFRIQAFFCKFLDSFLLSLSFFYQIIKLLLCILQLENCNINLLLFICIIRYLIRIFTWSIHFFITFNHFINIIQSIIKYLFNAWIWFIDLLKVLIDIILNILVFLFF